MSALVRKPRQDHVGSHVLPLPCRFGPYVLYDHVGSGGMAELYLAMGSPGMGGSRRVVIKLVKEALADQPQLAEMLVQEANLSTRLRHRNIVQVLELGRVAGRMYIAMEYVEGYDLNRLLRRLSALQIPLPLEFALFIVRDLLAALDFAHRAVDETSQPLGLVHRDISPSNVLISFDGEIRLCDFGIACATLQRTAAGVSRPKAQERAAAAMLAGKSGYMAPEHARDEAFDARSDLFSAGVVLWELCAGRRMRRGDEGELLELARSGQSPSLPRRGLPHHAHLHALVEKALAADPEKRFQQASEMRTAVEQYALATGLLASELRFGRWLADNFASEIALLRDNRQRSGDLIASSSELELSHVKTPEGQQAGAVEEMGPPEDQEAPKPLQSSGQPSVREVDASAIRPRPAYLPPVSGAFHSASVAYGARLRTAETSPAGPTDGSVPRWAFSGQAFIPPPPSPDRGWPSAGKGRAGLWVGAFWLGVGLLSLMAMLAQRYL